jgi:hypothetical protein
MPAILGESWSGKGRPPGAARDRQTTGKQAPFPTIVGSGVCASREKDLRKDCRFDKIKRLNGHGIITYVNNNMSTTVGKSNSVNNVMVLILCKSNRRARG